MSNEIKPAQPGGHTIEVVNAEKADIHNIENVRDGKYDEVQFKADAMEAENAEHDMTVLQAVKAYPMACLWAFIMSSTIVSFAL
jgi:SP family general alpha glucoside:H+ symporter-like MFS transporter